MKLPNGYGSITKLSGKRRRPYVIRKTVGWDIDKESGRATQRVFIIGYAATRMEAMQMLAEYNNSPYDLSASKSTFSEVYERWSAEKYLSGISKSNIHGYQASYKVCSCLYEKVFKEIKLANLQYVIDSCGKNYPTLRKLKVLFNQLYEYAMKHEICNKDYSEYVNIIQHKDKNPNKKERDKFTDEEISRIWELSDDRYYQTILILIYSGVRVSELLNLKKNDVHLEEQYFDVISSKTDNGIRKVPIADKVLPFYRTWYDMNDEYLLSGGGGKKIDYHTYLDSYFKPLLENLKIKGTPHFCRHTCISLLARAKVDQTTIKKIVGHSGAMTLTEKVYTHLDIQELINAINKI